MKVLILGASGMLGSAVKKLFDANSNLKVIATSRFKNSETVYFDALQGDLNELIKKAKPDYVVNCIGIIKQKITNDELSLIKDVIRLNSLLPYEIANLAARYDFRVLQIATDCVFNGKKGNYSEEANHDASDLYGRTKSLGEVSSKQVMNLRVSIIGQEIHSQLSLMSWFLNQPKDALVRGFVDHSWNGVTSLAFAKIIEGIILTNFFIPGVQHLVPLNYVSKYELLENLARLFDREDISLIPFTSTEPINRVLVTNHPEVNQRLWSCSTYRRVLSIQDLLQDLASNSRTFRSK